MTDDSAGADSQALTSALLAEWPTIPGYAIEQELGRGGMGVVYRALIADSQQAVALKLLRDSALAGPQELARFQIEAEAASRMEHPNIVQIHEVGEHDGRPYFAMELVSGGSLDKRLVGQGVDVRQAATLIRTITLAIEHAHARKIVHRDLKPANILLDALPETDRALASNDSDSVDGTSFSLDCFIPKITDFGLAKRLDSDSTAWTVAGAVLGTANYMAPEQADGRVAEIGPAADVYSLGAILYELLTGRPPFQSDSWYETIMKVLRDQPDAPTRWRPEVPRDLEVICLKCLEKTPDQRYTAKELAADLGRFLNDQPVTAMAISGRERLARLAAQDGYRIVEEIGRGPRSVVYRAMYEPLQQTIALKVFAAAGSGTREDWESRLRGAAGLWSALSHPQIVTVHRAGWWDGAGYAAMEFLPHGSLAAKIAAEPMRVRDSLRLAEQCAGIVNYLHRQGVVHGNLKPTNVLLAADGIPRIVDFHPTAGRFHNSPASGDEDRDGDRASSALGYMAPELVSDPPSELRPLVDVYGLGLVLYELLAGAPPFPSAGLSERDVLEQVKSREPVAPSQFNPEVTPPIDALVLRCLAKNPWRRFHRVYDVITRLRRLREELQGKGASGDSRRSRRPQE
jgi:eukaryotic-like serine/threonine-protein kinase